MDIPTYTMVSLCSGGGGLDLGIELAIKYYGGAISTQCYVERELYAASILAQRMEEGHIPPAPIWSDVKTFADGPGQHLQGKLDILTGGYPCQPFSAAGQRKGVDDPRHLWPDICRIITTIRPVWCFFENVSGHLSLGFDQVVRDLHELGYAVETGMFTASEVGATHQRKRLFILAGAVGLADSPKNRWRTWQGQNINQWEEHKPENGHEIRATTGSGGVSTVADTLGVGQERSDTKGTGRRQPEDADRNGSTFVGNTQHNGPSATTQRRSDAESSGPSETGVGQAHACKQGSQGSKQCRTPEEWHGQKASGSVAEFCLPLFPPGPNDDAGWAKVLRQDSTLKPAIRELANELAPVLEYRRDALRLLGNGVVPIQAAYAFITLAEQFQEHLKG